MRNVSTIGVLGGMGPQATNHFCSLITSLTPATCDQDHIPVITFNNSRIPSRLDAVLRGAASPLPELIRTARALQEAGADFLVMPCNSAHFYIDELRDEVGIPILDMVEHTVDFVVRSMPDVQKVGILASSATIESRLYLHPFLKQDIALLTPLPSHQRTVMDAIFGDDGVKAGKLEGPRQSLYMVADTLLDCGAEAVLAGCTEVSVAFENQAYQFTFIDPLRIMAQVSVERALSHAHGKYPAHAR
jgi:aspartate racemase